MDMMFHGLTITDSDFQRLVQFIHANYGIDLSKKRQLITSRLSHALKEEGYQDFSSFLQHLFTAKDPKDLELVLNKLTTNYTYFLREKDHFTFFQNTVLPELEQRHRRDKVLSIWSAGCSSGEEPYTLSIYLKEYFGPQASQWDTRILATDISQQAMAKAKAAVYQPPADMPDAWLRRYFLPSRTHPGEYTVTPAIRDNVIFRTFNLMDPIQFKLKFDVIFCRNVMIYFDQSTRDALIRRFYNAMAPNAYLFISHSESLGQTPLFRMVAPAVYRKNSAPTRLSKGSDAT
ncbi:CheR family methyltransferase [uncultured Pseudoflavonifractor sp.]|uniref:CheR family methyltransferase n=1 Tax=uncultured Pseudoflavonifractor sp. TaxID=1221379 RepID=UPI0034459468